MQTENILLNPNIKNSTSIYSKYKKNNEVINFGQLSFEYDKEATQLAYKNIESFCVQQCKCSYCTNFNASRKEIYPKEFLQLLHRLGIDHKKEAEIYHIEAFDNDKHLYGGWFHFTGRIIDYGNENEIIHFGENLEIFFTDNTVLVDSAFGQKAVLQLEFKVVSPWLIKETE